MKFRFRSLIFILIGLSLISCSLQKSSQEIAETVKKSIVLISYQNESGHGTGFIVPGPTGVCTVLTARHVVEGRSLNLTTNDQKLHKTNSIQASPNLDLAVVTFQSGGETCPYPSLNFGDSDSVKQTDRIYISGYPDRVGSPKLVQQFVVGSVSGLDVLEQGYGISYDANTYGGMSGGPVLDTSGKVVAVHGKTDAQIVADLQSQQASLSEQQKATLQQAAARVAGGGVQINTFKWGIPIKTYWWSYLAQPTKESVCKQDWYSDDKDWFGKWLCEQELWKGLMYNEKSGERTVFALFAWLILSSRNIVAGAGVMLILTFISALVELVQWLMRKLLKL